MPRLPNQQPKHNHTFILIACIALVCRVVALFAFIAFIHFLAFRAFMTTLAILRSSFGEKQNRESNLDLNSQQRHAIDKLEIQHHHLEIYKNRTSCMSLGKCFTRTHCNRILIPALAFMTVAPSYHMQSSVVGHESGVPDADHLLRFVAIDLFLFCLSTSRRGPFIRVAAPIHALLYSLLENRIRMSCCSFSSLSAGNPLDKIAPQLWQIMLATVDPAHASFVQFARGLGTRSALSNSLTLTQLNYTTTSNDTNLHYDIAQTYNA